MKYSILLIVFLGPACWASGVGRTCSYSTWEWDTIQKKSVNHRRIVKLRSQLMSEEMSDVEGCTVCEEDQAEIRIAGVPPIKVCKKIFDRVLRALSKAQEDGFPIKSLSGYRVGKSRGATDSRGIRSGFSNHSFGIAIDINSEANGLYSSCLNFSDGCKLIRGGPYDLKKKESISKNSAIYGAFREQGFKWGGEIVSYQKDFMHFSPTGL